MPEEVTPLFGLVLCVQALQMVNAIQVRSHQHHNNQPPPQQQQQSVNGRRSNRGPAGPAADLLDTSAQQQIAALGALVALLLQLQVRGTGPGAVHWLTLAALQGSTATLQGKCLCV